MSTTASPQAFNSKFQRLVAKYREDHRHPVNHVLHVGVGWPMVGAALLLLPFRPFWSLPLGSVPRGLAVARESGQIVTWDEHHWLHLLNPRGQRQGQARPFDGLAAAVRHRRNAL